MTATGGRTSWRTSFVFAPGVGLALDSEGVNGDGDGDGPLAARASGSADAGAHAAASGAVRVLLPGTGPGARYGDFTWRSAVVLAQAVWRHADQWVAGRSVVELGAGTALPGLLSARLGARRVVLTDRSDAPGVLEACRDACRLNGLDLDGAARRSAQIGCASGDAATIAAGGPGAPSPCLVSVAPLDWGHFDAAFFALPPFDTVLGADVFYEPDEFEDCVATAALLLRRGPPGARFVTTYQNRSPDASLAPHALRHGLRVAEVALRDVYPADQRAEADIENATVHLLVLTLAA